MRLVKWQRKGNIVPEIVECEKLRRTLEKYWRGKRIEWFGMVKGVMKESYFPGSNRDLVFGFLLNERVGDVRRRGKYLAVDLETKVWVMHMHSTGWWVPLSKEAGEGDLIQESFLHSVGPQTERFRMKVGGGDWSFRDARTWAKFWVLNLLKGWGPWEELGPDWIDEREEAVKALCNSRSNCLVKDVLIDQSITAGLGYYLSNEAMFVARVNPFRRWGDLTGEERVRVASAVQLVVGEAERSKDHSHWRVFDKKGEKCPYCGNEIERMKLREKDIRGTYVCRNCQRI